jgi:integrase
VRRPEKVDRCRLDRKTGRRYEYHVYQVRVCDEAGRMRYKYFRTEREAMRFCRAVEDRKESGAPLQFDKTFSELAEEFRRGHAEHALRPSSRKDTLRILRRLERRFSTRKLFSIYAPDFERFRDEELAELRAQRQSALSKRINALRLRLAVARRADSRDRLKREIAVCEGALPSVTTVGLREMNKCIALARQLFTFAVGRRYVTYNPAKHCRMLKRPTEGGEGLQAEAVLTPAEVIRLADAAEDPRSPPLPGRAAILVLGFGGLRLGELLGLTWGDFEFDRHRILVRRQLEAITGELRDTKTRAGVRFVELPATAIRELKAWRLRCPKGPLDLCFPNSDGRPMDDRNFRTRVFYPALRRAGLRRIRVHDLRHTAASMLIATGADLATISRQMGHANTSITLSTYTHWFAQRTESGLGARLDALVERETGGCEVVASSVSGIPCSAEVVDSMVARGGIEPPTRGFSVRCSTN